MTRAISVKFIPATNFKPARLKAFDNHGNSVTKSLHNLNWSGKKAYAEMAENLKNKMNWTGKLVGGWAGNVAVFVFLD